MTKDLYIGIDIGGSKIKSVAMQNNRAIDFFALRYDNKKLAPSEMKNNLAATVDNLKINRKFIKAIGVAFPSLVIKNKNPYISYNNQALKNLKIDKFLNKKYGAPVFLGNDANLAALGEWVFGFNMKPESFFLINLGTGCGSGFVKNGKLFSGYKSSALELGHIPMGIQKNLKCRCGGIDHVESYLSSHFFRHHGLNAVDEAKKAAAGGKQSKALFEEFGKYLGYTASNFFLLLEPEIIAITGGIAEAHRFFIKKANAVCRANKFIKNIRPDFEIKVARTGNNAACLGAALWATGKYK